MTARANQIDEVSVAGESSSHRILSIPMRIDVILGSAKLSIEQLTNTSYGDIIPLNRKIGEPVDLSINGRIFARGHIVVMENDNSLLGITLSEIT
jgi:flagellar motor switch protein FliN/FliY